MDCIKKGTSRNREEDETPPFLALPVGGGKFEQQALKEGVSKSFLPQEFLVVCYKVHKDKKTILSVRKVEWYDGRHEDSSLIGRRQALKLTKTF